MHGKILHPRADVLKHLVFAQHDAESLSGSSDILHVMGRAQQLLPGAHLDLGLGQAEKFRKLRRELLHGEALEREADTAHVNVAGCRASSIAPREVALVDPGAPRVEVHAVPHWVRRGGRLVFEAPQDVGQRVAVQVYELDPLVNAEVKRIFACRAASASERKSNKGRRELVVACRERRAGLRGYLPQGLSRVGGMS